MFWSAFASLLVRVLNNSKRNEQIHLNFCGLGLTNNTAWWRSVLHRCIQLNKYKAVCIVFTSFIFNTDTTQTSGNDS